MTIANLPKAWILALGIVSITILMAFNRISSEAGLPVLTALSGYGIGNGIGAATASRNGTRPSPHIFEPDKDNE